jgi:hypothetical protein
MLLVDRSFVRRLFSTLGGFEMRRISKLAQMIRAIVEQNKTLALLFALALAMLLSPAVMVTHAESFSVTTTGLLDSAAQIFNGLWPVFAIIAGLGLGIALVKFIVKAVQSAFGG